MNLTKGMVAKLTSEVHFPKNSWINEPEMNLTRLKESPRVKIRHSTLGLPERKNVPVKTKYIYVKYMTFWLFWWQKF